MNFASNESFMAIANSKSSYSFTIKTYPGYPKKWFLIR